HALDFYIAGVSLEHLREIGLRLQRGGVGFYPTSGSPFVHMDTGGVRMWARMTHEELGRVFPDARTVHIPSDGKPLPGYAVALADIRKRGGAPSELSLDAARSAGVNVETVLASSQRAPVNPVAKLLGLARDDEEDEGAPAAAATVASTATPGPAKPATSVRIASAQPEIEKRKTPPGGAEFGADKSASITAKPKLVQVAALLPPVPSNMASESVDGTNLATPNDIIRVRGYWQGPPDAIAGAPYRPRHAPSAPPAGRRSATLRQQNLTTPGRRLRRSAGRSAICAATPRLERRAPMPSSRRRVRLRSQALLQPQADAPAAARHRRAS